MKKLIVMLFGHRAQKQHIDLSSISSVLLKPIGDAVGDAIVHIAHLNQLKNAFPNITIGVIVSERNKTIFECSGLVDVLVEDRCYHYFRQRNKWQLYLDFMPNYTSRSIFLDYILNPEIIINFGKTQKKNYNLETVQNYDFTTSIPEFTHIRHYLNYSALAPFLPQQDINYSLPVPAEDTLPICWGENNIKISLNPQGSTRQIPPEELNLLLKGIDKKFLPYIELLLTNTKNSPIYLEQLSDIPVMLRLAPPTDMTAYFQLIHSADIVIAVDSGAVHIACAYGKPLLAFYANNSHNLARWAPMPKANVNVLTLIGKTQSDNNGTQEFELDKAINWLNAQIEEQYFKKLHPH